MRRIFASPRLENVEGVAHLLEDAGIEVRITDGRSYRGAIRGNFSYRADAREGPEPAVWIVNAEDQPRARELMRGAGLLDSTRAPLDSYLPANDDTTSKPRRSSRLKLGLLAAIAIAVALGSFALRHAATPAPAEAAPETISPLPTALPDGVAELMLLGELSVLDGRSACIGLAGEDAPSEMLGRLAKADSPVLPLSACIQDTTGIHVRASGKPAVLLALRDYVRTPDGGRVVLRRMDEPMQALDRTYVLHLDQGQWSVAAEANPASR